MPSAPHLFGPIPPSQAGGPEPAHLALCGGLLLVLALVTSVVILRRRKERPRRTQSEGAFPGPDQPEGIEEVRPAERGRARNPLAVGLNLLSNFIAFVFAVLFVLTALLALPLFDAGRQLFDPNLYQRALVEENIYEKFPGLVAEQFAFQLAFAEKRAGIDTENMTASPELEACLREALGDAAFDAISGFEREPDDAEIERMRPCFAQYGAAGGEGEGEEGGGGPPAVFARLTPSDMEGMLSILIPRAWLQAQAESVIEQAFASLKSATPTPITISVAELREHLAGGAAVEAFLNVVRGQPPCTEQELAALSQEPLRDLPPCRPPEPMLDALAEEGGQVLTEAILKIPDQVNLSETFRGDGEAAEASPSQGAGPLGDSPLEALRRIRMVMNLSPLLPAALLLLVTLFGVRSVKGLLRWWGLPFLLVGLFAAGVAFAAVPAMDWAIEAFVMARLPPSLSSHLVQVGMGVGRYVVRSLGVWIGAEAGVIGLTGLVMVVASRFVKPRQASRPDIQSGELEALG